MSFKNTLSVTAAAACLMGASYYYYALAQPCAIDDCVGHLRLIISKEKMNEIIDDLKV